MTPAAEPLVLVGQIDGIAPEGTVTGWCWSPQEPSIRREVVLVADGRVLTTALAGWHRDALVALGVGDGSHGFAAAIPRDSLLPAAGSVALQMQDAASGQPVGAPVRYVYAATEAPARAGTLRAFIEDIGEEGLVRGWCWSPEDPAGRIRLNVLVDGTVVGSTLADLHRADLEQAGIGDGAHAFVFLLPWDAIATKSAAQVTVAEARTGMLLPASSIFRRPMLRPVEERLRDLERQVRLLGSQLTEVDRRANHDRAMLGGVLATVGAFFTRLSQTAPGDIPTALVPSLPDLVEDAIERLGALSLAISNQPAMTVCIRATGTLAELHACLAACHAAGLDRQADIVVLDSGEVDEAALLPSVVQNVRYWRLAPGQSFGDALLLAATRPSRYLTTLLSPAVRVGPDWLDHCLALFGRNPSCGIVVPKLLRENGAVVAFGLLPRAGRLVDMARAEPAADPDFDYLQPVAAPSAEALVIRTPLLEAFGGLDPACGDMPSALADLGLRCWASGNAVLSQGAGTLLWQDSVLEGPGLGVEASALLSHRWFASIPSAWPRPLGQALIIGGANPVTDLDCATALQALGWQVSFGAPSLDGAAPPAAAMRDIGVRVLRSPFQPSLSAALEASAGGYALIRLGSGALAAFPADRARSLSPRSKLLLDVTDDTVDARVLAAAIVSDAVRAEGATAAALRRAGYGNALLPALTAPPGFDARNGFWLLTGPGEAGTADMAWLASAVLPGLRKALPGVALHRPARADTAKRAGVVDHRDATVRASVRLVLAACRKAAPEAASLAACAAEGTPVLVLGISPDAAMAEVPPGVTPLPQAVMAAVREIVRHNEDAEVWQAAAPPPLEPEAARMAGWAAALIRLGLPHNRT